MAEQHFTLTSGAFENGTFLPSRHTCDGQNVSPELSWMHPPRGTLSYALLMEDVDAANGAGFTHWLLFDIPADRRELPGGAHGVGVPGRNDFHHHRYAGPCPPPNQGEHRYHFRLYALDVETLGLPADASREQVAEALGGHVLGETELVARYGRSAGH
jgi:hypothetical protein